MIVVVVTAAALSTWFTDRSGPTGRRSRVVKMKKLKGKKRRLIKNYLRLFFDSFVEKSLVRRESTHCHLLTLLLTLLFVYSSGSSVVALSKKVEHRCQTGY